MRWAWLAFGVVLLTGCPTSNDIDPMELQQRYKPYDPSSFYPDGRSLRPPPPGTIPRSATVDDPAYTTGMVNGVPVSVMPVQVTDELLRLGRTAFDISCAPCHGLLGDGNSVVASKMSLRTPPSLLTPRIRTLSDGLVFQAISEGYGLMPGYAAELSAEERWGVVAYVRALQLSQDAPLDWAPRDVRERLEKEAP